MSKDKDIDVEYEIVEFVGGANPTYRVAYNHPKHGWRKIDVPAFIDPNNNTVQLARTRSQIETHIKDLCAIRTTPKDAEALIGYKGNTRRKKI
jgi:hypothetical protein